MKRNFLYAVMTIPFLFAGGAHANHNSLDKVLKHKEWVTGSAKLQYKISNANQETINHINHKFVKSKFADDVKEFVHFGHVITSIDTKYEPRNQITKIDSFFWVDIHGFETTNEPQLFTVSQETCIDPHSDRSGDQSTCVNSEDTILVDEIVVVHLRNLNIKAYNLKPGTYVASTEIMIQQIFPEPKSPIGYTTSNRLLFTVNAP